MSVCLQTLRGGKKILEIISDKIIHKVNVFYKLCLVILLYL